MADKKSKVSVYDGERDQEKVEKSGGIPGWVIALIVVAVIILALIFLL